MDIAKAGWLFRQSSLMHRWKKHWFVLNTAGELRYFDNPEAHNPEERFVLRAVVVDVRAGDTCKASPPDGYSKSCLLEMKMREGSHLRLCAESADDMKAWQMAIDESRALHTQQPPAVMNTMGAQVVYPGGGYAYPGQVLAMPTQSQYVVHNAATGARQTVVVGGTTPNVVYMDEPRHYRHRRYCNGRYMCGPGLFFY